MDKERRITLSFYGGFKPYVSVAKQRAKAERHTARLKKKGVEIFPVQTTGRKIATTYWGKAWCEHIESFSDYENRLPRGRRYVCNGSVFHLAIDKKTIKAMVSGSEIYNVTINIKPLTTAKWQQIKKVSAGQISSLLDLLSGQLSDGVMNTVADRETGLFPSPDEIDLDCDCPDWATMCKHIAAVLYGVGTRLDHSPEHLFLLRGVNHEELVDVSAAVIDVTQTDQAGRRRLDTNALADVFDIDLSEPATPVKKKKTKLSEKPKLPLYFTGVWILKKRKALGLTQAKLAAKIGASPAALSLWERKGRKRLLLKPKYEKALRQVLGHGVKA